MLLERYVDGVLRIRARNRFANDPSLFLVDAVRRQRSRHRMFPPRLARIRNDPGTFFEKPKHRRIVSRAPYLTVCEMARTSARVRFEIMKTIINSNDL